MQGCKEALILEGASGDQIQGVVFHHSEHDVSAGYLHICFIRANSVWLFTALLCSGTSGSIKLAVSN